MAGILEGRPFLPDQPVAIADEAPAKGRRIGVGRPLRTQRCGGQRKVELDHALNLLATQRRGGAERQPRLARMADDVAAALAAHRNLLRQVEFLAQRSARHRAIVIARRAAHDLHEAAQLEGGGPDLEAVRRWLGFQCRDAAVGLLRDLRRCLLLGSRLRQFAAQRRYRSFQLVEPRFQLRLARRLRHGTRGVDDSHRHRAHRNPAP